MAVRPVVNLKNYERGPCPAQGDERCTDDEFCAEPVLCLIDRVSQALGDPRRIIIDTRTYTARAAARSES